jgi:hypothetical protein
MSSTTEIPWNSSPTSTLAAPFHDDQMFSPPLGLPTPSGPEDGVHTDIGPPSSRKFEGPSCNTKSTSSPANSKGAVSLLGARRGLRAQLTSRRTREKPSPIPSPSSASTRWIGTGPCARPSRYCSLYLTRSPPLAAESVLTQIRRATSPINNYTSRDGSPGPP